MQRWLARTPGIFEEEPENEEGADADDTADADDSPPVVRARNNFWNRYLDAVDHFLKDMQGGVGAAQSAEEQEQAHAEFLKTKRSFDTITDRKIYQIFLDKRE